MFNFAVDLGLEDNSTFAILKGADPDQIYIIWFSEHRIACEDEVHLDSKTYFCNRDHTYI